MTRDIDIVIEVTLGQVDSLCQAFSGDEFYVSRAAAVEAVQRCGQFNLLHPSSGNKIDFMIAGASDWAKSQLERRRLVDFESSFTGFVAAPEDVILGKLIYYRDGKSEKHLRDIRGILKVTGPNIDMEYLSDRAAQLAVGDIWETIVAKH